MDGSSSVRGGGSVAAHTSGWSPGTMKRETQHAGSCGDLQAAPCPKGEALRGSWFHSWKGEVSSESGW